MVSSVISSVDYDALSVYFVNSAVLLKKNGAIYLEGEEDIPFWNFVFMQGTPSSEFELVITAIYLEAQFLFLISFFKHIRIHLKIICVFLKLLNN